MPRYWRVETVRTVEERRVVYIEAEDADSAKDAAKDHADWEAIKTPWIDPLTAYTIMNADEIDKPSKVDVQV